MMSPRSHRPVAAGLAALLVVPLALSAPQRQHGHRRRGGRAGDPAAVGVGRAGPGSSGARQREVEQQRDPTSTDPCRQCPRRGYLSMSPTTKNIEPRIATMSAIRLPGSTSPSTEMLLNDAERSLSRHGVLSPRETR